MTTVDGQPAEAAKQRCFKFREAVVSDIGCRRKDNQDAYGIAHTAAASLFIVADGMGGARGGATASTIAVRVIAEEALERDGDISLSSLKSAIELANKIIFVRSGQDEELTGMGTTLAALAVVGRRVFVAHVGDSRVYMLRGERLCQLTRDHTLVQELVDTGAIPAEEAANHPIAHMLTRSLGPTEAVEVELRVLPEEPAPGDRFLLCSDGLYNLVLDDEIEEVLAKNTVEGAVKVLLQLALERGGTDNCTIQVIEFASIDDPGVAAEYPPPGNVKTHVSVNAEVDDFNQLLTSVKAVEPSQAPEPETSSAASAEEPPVPAAPAPLEVPAESPSPEINGAGSGAVPEEEFFGFDEDLSAALDEIEQPAGEKPAEGSRAPEAEALRQYEGAYEQANAELSRIQHVVFAMLLLLAAIVTYSVWARGGRTPIIVAGDGTAPDAAPAASEPPSAAIPTGAVKDHDDLRQELEIWATKRNTSASGEGIPETEEEQLPAPSVAAGTPADVSPENLAKILEEPPVKPSPSAAAAPPQPEGAPEDAAVEELKQRVNKFSVAEEDDDESEDAVAEEPIEWDRENKRVQKMMVMLDKSQQQAPPENTAPKTLAAQDIEKMAAEKEDVRTKIVDFEAKLRALALGPEEAKTQRTKVREELQTVERALKKTSEALLQKKEELEMWLSFKREAAEKNKIKLADEIAEFDESVRQKKEAYTEGSAKYLDAVDRWQQSPSDVGLASKMGLLGRIMQKKRTELEQSVTIATAENVQRLVNDLSEQQVTYDNLVRYNSQLNRHLGYLEHPTQLPANRKKEIQNNYEKEKEELTERLAALKRDLPDEQEVQFLRGKNASQLNVQVQ